MNIEDFDSPQDYENAVMAEYQQGHDVQQFDALVRSATPALRRSLAAAGLQDADIEDVLQETWISVFRAADRFAGRSNVRSWVHAIAYRQRISLLRAKSATHLGDNDAVIPARAPEERPFEHIIDHLPGAFNELPERSRQHAEAMLQGLSEAETAARLNIAPGTVKSGRNAMRERLGDLLRSKIDN